MEQKQPKASRRSGSFNPEAPTFSPTAAETTMSTGPAGPTPPTSPRQRSMMPYGFDEDSPFRPTRDMRPNYQGYEETNAVQMPKKLPNQKDMPLDALQKMLREHHIALNQDRSGVDLNALGVDELSAGLGLPGTKTNVDSPVRSHKSRDSEGLSEGLFAQYMSCKSELSDDITTTPRGIKGYGLDMYSGELEGGNQPMKLVAPPPGFMGERPRRIFAEEHSSVNPMMSPLRQIPTGPAAFGHPRRFSDLQSTNVAQQHGNARGPPRQYRQRALTRTKRTDQGPEPSHADIYPDDASFMPRRPSYQPESIGTFQGYMSEMPSAKQFRAQDEGVWPTPAEVYKRKPDSPPRRSVFARNASFMENRAPDHWSPPPASSMSQYMQQFGEPSHPLALKFPPPEPSPSPPFDIFAGHYYPTEADIHEPDAEMECLLAIIPHIFDLDLPELPCDPRPLTPGQTDGTRYGLGFHGIGLGDGWKCPDAREGEPFRVRPRDHEGWGGWQWAIDRGWGNE